MIEGDGLVRRARARFNGALVGVAILIFYVGGGIIGMLIMPVLTLANRDRTKRQVACQRLVRASWRSFWLLLRVLRLVDFDPRRMSGPTLAPPYVLVANHPSLLDVVAVGAVIEAGCVVVRRKTFGNPFITALVLACGYIVPGRDRSLGARQVPDEMVERLRRGLPVVVFPEGTRSPPDGLHPFARGAFHAARLAQVPVLPAFIEVEPRMLDHQHPWHDMPPHIVRYRLRFGEPLHPLAGEGVRSLTRRVEVAFEQAGFPIRSRGADDAMRSTEE